MLAALEEHNSQLLLMRNYKTHFKFYAQITWGFQTPQKHLLVSTENYITWFYKAAIEGVECISFKKRSYKENRSTEIPPSLFLKYLCMPLTESRNKKNGFQSWHGLMFSISFQKQSQGFNLQ